jgi:catechol 2,3-dioxygenase-like lactoylglutathione lyase family enzyme
MSAATKMKANVQQAVPFFMVHDIDASLRFYVDGLGFTKTEDWVVDSRVCWCWLVLDGVALMLQEFSKTSHHANVPAEKLGAGVSICFICNDALALYREFKQRGVDAKRPFVGNRMWVTSLVDPDGYRLDFESKTDAPEESELPDES